MSAGSSPAPTRRAKTAVICIAAAAIAFAIGHFWPAAKFDVVGAPSPPATPDRYQDLRRVDRYEHKKRQISLREHANLVWTLNQDADPLATDPREKSSPPPNSVIEIERQRNLKSYGALIETIDRLDAANSDQEYDELAEQEKAILQQIEADRLDDQNDLRQLRSENGEIMAAALAIIQRLRRGGE